jgi:hypothetical protein
MPRLPELVKTKTVVVEFDVELATANNVVAGAVLSACTDNLAQGEVDPIPTFPPDNILICGRLDVETPETTPKFRVCSDCKYAFVPESPI